MARGHFNWNTKMKPRKTEKAKKVSWKKKAQKEFSHIQFHGAKMLASGESKYETRTHLITSVIGEVVKTLMFVRLQNVESLKPLLGDNMPFKKFCLSPSE